MYTEDIMSYIYVWFNQIFILCQNWVIHVSLYIRQTLGQFFEPLNREWAAQMWAYIQSTGLWLIVNGTTTAPTGTTPAGAQALTAWTLSDSMANGNIELHLSHNIRNLVADTSAETWTAFGMTGVSQLFGDFRSMVQFHLSRTQHPSVEMSRFNTYVERLKAAGVDYSDYTLGMLLLNALWPKWDHVAAMYLHGKTDHTAIDYTAVRNAIVAEYDRTSASAGTSKHVDKISATKRKAEGSGQPNSEKKKAKKTKNKAALAMTAPQLMISLQPLRAAAPNTSTIALFKPLGTMYLKVAAVGPQNFTRGPKAPRPNTLQLQRNLLRWLGVTPSTKPLKMASAIQVNKFVKSPEVLEARRQFQTFVSESPAVWAAVAASNQATDSNLESGPSRVRFDDLIPPPVAHMCQDPKNL